MFSWIRHYKVDLCALPSALLVVFVFPGHTHGWFCVWVGHEEVLVVRVLRFSLGIVRWGCGVWYWVLFVAHLIHLFAPSSFHHLHHRCVLCGYLHRLPSLTTLLALHVPCLWHQPMSIVGHRVEDTGPIKVKFVARFQAMTCYGWLGHLSQPNCSIMFI